MFKNDRQDVYLRIFFIWESPILNYSRQLNAIATIAPHASDVISFNRSYTKLNRL
ncbi:hypothetical protein [Nostoc sp.]|uniref:hypothetical protein n=1 Tax=Nostoc sp. TaxID=1180 RepID=UPI002FF80A31